jgi:deoxyribose-phosphate aldolase
MGMGEVVSIKLTAAELAKYFDHTALKAEITAKDIVALCEEAKMLGTEAVCVNPLWIPLAGQILRGTTVMPITVVGFPLGAMGTDSKIFEAKVAVSAGAKEIDMVLSVGELKSKMFDEARRDIVGVKKAIGSVPLKVIFETSLLTPDEIAMVSKWCAEDGIDFVKTSTGFGSRGASVEDIKIMHETIQSVKGSNTKIKASGGIRTLKDTLALIEAGASRIGASATKSIVQELEGGLADQRKGY